MDDYHERWLRMQEMREEELHILHFEASMSEETGGHNVDYEIFYTVLLPESDECSFNEPFSDCFIHRLMTRRGGLFKAITRDRIGPPF